MLADMEVVTEVARVEVKVMDHHHNKVAGTMAALHKAAGTTIIIQVIIRVTVAVQCAVAKLTILKDQTVVLMEVSSSFFLNLLLKLTLNSCFFSLIRWLWTWWW